MDSLVLIEGLKKSFMHMGRKLDVLQGIDLNIRLGKEELTTMSSTRLAAVRNRDIGFVFQFHHLLPEFTALENLMIPGLIQGRSKREMEKRGMALLEEVGLEKRATHRPGELSGAWSESSFEDLMVRAGKHYGSADKIAAAVKEHVDDSVRSVSDLTHSHLVELIERGEAA